MKNLREKMKSQGGFTLIEMLIVVAIIAILVAVSIPLVNTSLDDARKAADDANLRAAKTAAVLMYMNHKMNPDDATKYPAPAANMVYDHVAGTFDTSSNVSDQTYGQYGNHDYIKIETVNDAAQVPVTVVWNTDP